MKIGKKEKEQARIAKEWNEKHPVGIAVIVTKDDRTEFKTKTRSSAYMLGESGEYPGHTAVVMLEGISGCYALDRVKPIQRMEVKCECNNMQPCHPDDKGFGICGDFLGLTLEEAGKNCLWVNAPNGLSTKQDLHKSMMTWISNTLQWMHRKNNERREHIERRERHRQ